MALKHQLELANKQRLIALINAYKIIDEFACPSLDPETFSKYHSVKKELIKIYSK